MPSEGLVFNRYDGAVLQITVERTASDLEDLVCSPNRLAVPVAISEAEAIISSAYARMSCGPAVVNASYCSEGSKSLQELSKSHGRQTASCFPQF